MKAPAKTLLALLLFTILIHPAFADPLIRPGDFPAGLQGWWKFDGNATDASPNGYNLANVGTPAYVAGDYWTTGEQSGSQTGANYWSIPDANCPNLALAGTSFSMAAWIKMDVIGPNNMIFRKWVSNVGYAFRVDSTAYPTSSTGYLSISFGGTELSTTAPVLSAGKWHHVAFVYDKARSVAAFYVDGNCVRSITHAVDLVDNSVSCDVGYVFPGGFPSLSLKGNIKDLAVWNRALTPIEIKSLALGVDLQTQAYRPGNVSVPPTAWWKLNEVSSGSVAVTRMDSSGTNHLTDNNTVGSGGGLIEGATAQFVNTNNESFSVSNRPDFDFGSSDFTLTTWAKFDAGPDIGRCLCGKISNLTGWLWMIAPGASRFMRLYDTGQSSVFVDLPAIASGSWYHLAVVRRGSSIRFFLDGKQVGVNQSAAVTYDGVSGPLTIGQYDGAGFFNGSMQDMAIWKGYALSDTEIKALATGLPLQRSGVVSYWNLNETNGTRVDSIGANNLSSNNGVGSAPGVVGNAADFERDNNQFLSIADAAQTGLDITQDLTVIAWVKPESTSALTFLDKNGNNEGYSLNTSVGNAYYFETYGTTAVSTTLAGAGAWQHVVGVRDGAQAKILINSATETSNAQTAGLNNTTTDFFLGRHYSVGSRYWDGLLDEVIIARRWFRDEEIKAIYNRGLNGLPALFTDTDGDGIPDEYETGTGVYVSPTNTGTNPNNPDTDGDSLTDGQEVNIYHTNPNLTDTDGDGFSDPFEINTGFDPTSALSTPESLSRILTAVEYRFNAALGVSYRIEASFDLVTWTTIETPIIGTGGEIARLYSIQGQPKRFFRSRRN